MGEMGEVISVVVCFSGGEALSMLATQAFDLVISDYNMPGMLGLELLKKIRQDQREIILILSTAYGTEALAEEVQQLKIGYIVKPFELSSLVKLIQSLIRSKTYIPSPKPNKLLGRALIDSGVPDL